MCGMAGQEGERNKWPESDAQAENGATGSEFDFGNAS